MFKFLSVKTTLKQNFIQFKKFFFDQTYTIYLILLWVICLTWEFHRIIFSSFLVSLALLYRAVRTRMKKISILTPNFLFDPIKMCGDPVCVKKICELEIKNIRSLSERSIAKSVKDVIYEPNQKYYFYYLV